MSTVIYIHKVVPSYLRCRCPCVFVAVSRSSQSVSTEGYDLPNCATWFLYDFLPIQVTGFSEKGSENVEVVPHGYTNHDLRFFFSDT